MGRGAEGRDLPRQTCSQAERIDRIAALARELAPACEADPDQAERAARLAKLDLRSSMVGEFPELQGVMGRYYAQEAGEPAAVADAARDHCVPRRRRLGADRPVSCRGAGRQAGYADRLLGD